MNGLIGRPGKTEDAPAEPVVEAEVVAVTTETVPAANGAPKKAPAEKAPAAKKAPAKAAPKKA
ncbi:hypothetical protein [Microbacterium aurum]